MLNQYYVFDMHCDFLIVYDFLVTFPVLIQICTTSKLINKLLLQKPVKN